MVGCETSAFLAEKGKTVTCLEMMNELAMDMEAISRTYVIKKMAEHKVEWFTGMTITEITDSGVNCPDKEGKTLSLEGDTVVLALGMEPVMSLEVGLRGKVREVYLTGDCEPTTATTDRPGGIYRAIHSGFRVANGLK